MPRAAMLAAGTALPLLVSALVDCSSSSPSSTVFYGVATCEDGGGGCHITMDASAPDTSAPDAAEAADSAPADTGPIEAASDAGTSPD
jgi:hypothetical protein